jgi:hypothetical protein
VARAPSRLAPTIATHTLRRAFQVWARHIDLDFVETDRDPVELEIRWESGRHGSCRPLDGRGGTLAHAFLPGQGPVSGDIHFDDDEDWTVGTGTGTDLLQVRIYSHV